jgi:hypothetical protein
MKKILFDASNGCFKGNMHCHSTCSDGKQTPEELKALYKAHGYSFLAITDHDHLNGHKDLDDESFFVFEAVFFLLANGTFVIYDIALTRLISMYIYRFRDKFRRFK